MHEHTVPGPPVEVERRADVRAWLATPPLRYPLAWLLASAALVALVALLGVIETPPALRWLTANMNDKLMHGAAYAGLMVVLAQVLIDRRARLVSLLLLLAVGLGVELLQTQTATRQFELLDLLANSVGTFAAWWLASRRVQSLLPRIEALLLAPARAEALPVDAIER